MIDERKTFEKFGYYSTDLKPKSNKKVIVICNKCGKERILWKGACKDLCGSCVKIGKKRSKETKQKISKNNADFSGRKHPQWNSNKTDEERQDDRSYIEYKEWRIAVFKRDLYTCQICKDNKGGNLNAHHLECYSNNPKLRTKKSNGITLCEKCHKNFHHIYSYHNNTKDQFIEFKVNRE